MGVNFNAFNYCILEKCVPFFYRTVFLQDPSTAYADNTAGFAKLATTRSIASRHNGGRWMCAIRVVDDDDGWMGGGGWMDTLLYSMAWHAPWSHDGVRNVCVH